MTSQTSLSKKLSTILARTVAACLLFVFLTSSVYQFEQRRNQKINELFAMAEIVAFNASAVLDFSDQTGAKELLAAFRQRPDVLAVELRSRTSDFRYGYYKTGSPGAEPSRWGHDESLGQRHTHLAATEAMVSVPVHQNGEAIGHIALTGSLHDLWWDLLTDSAVYLLGSVAAFLFAQWVARHQLEGIRRNLGKLTGTARRISLARDFSQRAEHSSDDEIGELADAFNRMLDELGENALHLKALAEESRLNALRADEANRAKSTFLATMSHEIRTPLNGILGMAQVLLTRDTSEENRNSCARVILESGKTLLSLLNDVLDLAKVEAGRMTLAPAPMQPAELLREIQQLFEPSARRKNIVLRINCDTPADQHYLADPVRLRQMLSNLVSNAIKFTPEGEVELAARSLTVDGREYLEFSVRDSGIGIPPEKLAVLFQPFSQVDDTTNRHFGGTGLGLSIVRELARLMGGDATVRSRLGEGSTFAFQIEAATIDQASQPPPQPGVDAASAASPRLAGHVLIVEDGLFNRQVLLKMLAHLGLSTECAEDGRKAVTLIEQGKTYDLILMDLRMPQMDGFEAAQAIRHMHAAREAPAIPIIALTADVFSEDRERCFAVGMSDFLPKPVDLGLLRERLQHWLPAARPGADDGPARAVEDAQPSPPPPDPVQLAQRLGALLPQIEDHMFDAVLGMQTLCSELAHSAHYPAAAEITALLNALDFDQAAARLRQWAADAGWRLDA